MRGFWLPIGLRAAAIFSLGMLVYAGGRYLKSHTHFEAVDARHPAVAGAAAHVQMAEAQVNSVAAPERAIEAAVRFQPGGTRAILASKATAAELSQGDPFAIDAGLTGPMNLSVNGEHGERVRLKSDSQNTALVVHDADGKAVVRMQAGKNGFSITVDTTGQ